MQSEVGSRWLLLGSAVAAVCLSSVACSEPTATFEVNGKIGGNADDVHDTGTCQYGNVWYHHDDDVVLWGADNTVLAADHLHVGPDTRAGPNGVCDLTFAFRDVRPGDVAYQLSIGANPKIIVTEDQLHASSFVLIPRATKAKVSSAGVPEPDNDDPNIRVITTPSSSPAPKS